MNTSQEKATERIVELVCDGYTEKEIEKKLRLNTYRVTALLSDARSNACLPSYKKDYPANKEAIMFNVKKWLKYKEESRELFKKYYNSLMRLPP